jgi:hypothetical protein
MSPEIKRAPSTSPTTRQMIPMTRTNSQHIVQAHRRPDADQDKCWFCGKGNTSTATECNFCYADTTPTRQGRRRVTYRIYSFGSQAKDFPRCEKQHASLLDQAVQLLDAGTLIAVRVGVDPMYAILIKDGDGTLRLKTEGVALPPNLSEIERFLHASRVILATDPDPDTGKTPKMHSNFIVLNPPEIGTKSITI